MTTQIIDGMSKARRCSIDGCEKKHCAKGWCEMHYVRWRKHGDPTYQLTAEARFKRRVLVTADCWFWNGTLMRNGYATFYNGVRRQLVHRYSYELHYGPIPDGMQVDHICHTRNCVNPKHLRAVTPKQNCENLSGPSTRSTTGIRGVYWAKHARKWLVRVGHRGKAHHGGYFLDKREAEAAAVALRNELFTHNDRDRGTTDA